MAMSDAAAKRRRCRQGLGGACTTITYVVHDQEWGEGRRRRAGPSSPLVLSPFTAGLGPFEQIAVVSVAAKHFRRRHGRGGAWMTILPLSLS